MTKHTYLAIDLKSFYASVECNERGLDPLRTNLVVADESRSEKTICLAVSPSLKSFGIPGRPRLFEVIKKIKELNNKRRYNAPYHHFIGSSYDLNELNNAPELAVSYLVATPRMALYLEYSTRIYDVYLKYIAPEDIHVYSIDEVFIDATSYLKIYQLSAHDLAMKIIQDILKTTGITATAGIGPNLYLAKVAMDIVAKHLTSDKNGVRIAQLDEMSYRKLLWCHRPLTDFWRVGRGYCKKLEAQGLYTMGDIARCSLGKDDEYYNEELLYELFGINAELLIDHAWGYEPCTIADIKAYQPSNKSIGSGQVLQSSYDYQKTKLVIKEMADLLALELVEKKLVTNQIILTVGYDISNLTGHAGTNITVITDRYGRKIPKQAHGTINLERKTASAKLIMAAVIKLYEQIINKKLMIKRIYLVANHVTTNETIKKGMAGYQQIDLFSLTSDLEERLEKEEQDLAKEEKLQEAILDIKNKFGKNAVLKGMNLEKGATTKERNKQIGGHKA